MFLLLLRQLAFGTVITISLVFWFIGALVSFEILDDKRAEWARRRADNRMFRQIEEYRHDFS